MEFSERRRWLWLEFAVIMLGVLSALLVDTWIQDREDSRRAEIYRERLMRCSLPCLPLLPLKRSGSYANGEPVA